MNTILRFSLHFAIVTFGSVTKENLSLKLICYSINHSLILRNFPAKVSSFNIFSQTVKIIFRKINQNEPKVEIK